MAERRYGFRFSFAEGCVIVVSLFGASFLVFLFGVYAGRELEARKAAEHTSSVRLTVSQDGRQAHILSQDGKPLKDGQDSPPVAPPVAQEASKTVVVINPPKIADSPTVPNSIAAPTTATTASPQLAKETEAKAETPQKSLSVPMERKAAVPPFSSVQHVQEKTQPLKETPAAQMNKKLQTTAGRWSVQIHATRDEGAAQQLARQLRTQGYAPAISKVVRDGEVWYRVRVGSFTNADEARASVGRLRKEGKFSQAYPVSN